MSANWTPLLGKLSRPRAAGVPNELEETLHSLVQESLQLDNREAIKEADIHAISELLSDWSVRYKDELSQATPTSCYTITLSSLKLLRNLCAGVPRNQSSILHSDVVITLLSLLTFLTEHLSHPHTLAPTPPVTVVMTTVQLLGNLCVAFPEGQTRIWKAFFPHCFRSLLCVPGVSDLVCSVLHSCTVSEETGAARRRSELVTTNADLLALIISCKTPDNDSDMEWRMMLLKSLLKVTPLRSLHHGLSAARPQEWLALLHLVRDLIETGSECGEWGEGECVYLVTMWRGDVEELLTNQMAALKECSCGDLEPSLSTNSAVEIERVHAVLRILCVLSLREATLHTLQKQELLMETVVELLQQLSVLDGSASSSQHRSSLKDAKPTGREREGVLFGVKRDLLQLISSLMYHCPLMQDKMRALDRVPLLLNQCHIDHKNPYIMQWAILAIRNLCEGNPANQQLIARLETQGVAETASQLQPGCEIQIGSDGKIKVKRKETDKQ